MGLRDHDMLIRLAASFGWSNAQIKNELVDVGESVSPQAVSKYIRVNQVTRRSKAESIAYWFGPLVIEQREEGQSLRAMSSAWSVNHQTMSKVLDLLELPGDERCSVELLVNVYPDELTELKTQQYSLRQVQSKLENQRGIRCALDTIRKAMEHIVSRTVEDWPETRALARLLQERPEKERRLIWAVIKQFAKTFNLD